MITWAEHHRHEYRLQVILTCLEFIELLVCFPLVEMLLFCSLNVIYKYTANVIRKQWFIKSTTIRHSLFVIYETGTNGTQLTFTKTLLSSFIDCHLQKYF